MDLSDVSALARALAGVRETSTGGRLRWSLRGRLVARQIDRTSIVIRTGFLEREQLLSDHPTTFFVPPQFDAHMMVVARLPDADPAAVAKAIRAAWHLQAP
jgi:hypothetical protein